MNPTPAQIIAERKALNLTQTEAGALVNVTCRAWQFWEAGERAMPAGSWKLFQIVTKRRKRKAP